MKEAPCIGIVERTEQIQHNGVPVTLDYIRCEEKGHICVVADDNTEITVIARLDNAFRPWGRVQLNGSKYLFFAKMMYLN